jgi:hypothetical protein
MQTRIPGDEAAIWLIVSARRPRNQGILLRQRLAEGGRRWRTGVTVMLRALSGRSDPGRPTDARG